jgi:hypothetical protein
LTPERRRQLKREYSRAVRNASAHDTQEAWLRYLAALYLEGNDYQFFIDIRAKVRANGARADSQYLDGEITARRLVRRLKEHCAERYAIDLTRFGVANIDIESPEFRTIIRKLGAEVLQTFKSVDPTSDTDTCLAMARTWHRLVQLVHSQYGLPSVRRLRKRLHSESDAETAILDSDDFETQMTDQERADWEAVIE